MKILMILNISERCEQGCTEEPEDSDLVSDQEREMTMKIIFRQSSLWK